jgi:hypothetical protein
MSTRRKRMPHASWVELIREQEASGKRVEDFCRERDLGVASFHHHRSRLRRDGRGDGGFVEVPAPTSSGLRLLCGGVILELERDFDAETLKRFLAVAGQ